MKKTLQNSLIACAGLVIPHFAFAAANLSGVRYMIRQVHSIINAVIPILIGLAFIGFAWGIIVYLFSDDKEKGKDVMIMGIIALFVMTSVWGLVGIVRVTLLGENVDNQVMIPTVLPQ